VVFAWLLSAGMDSGEKKRFVAIGIFFLASALFWSAFEQAGSTLICCRGSTRQALLGSAYGELFPISQFAVHHFWLAPLIAWLWDGKEISVRRSSLWD